MDFDEDIQRSLDDDDAGTLALDAQTARELLVKQILKKPRVRSYPDARRKLHEMEVDQYKKSNHNLKATLRRIIDPKRDIGSPEWVEDTIRLARLTLKSEANWPISDGSVKSDKETPYG